MWLGTGLYFFVSRGGLGSLLSIKALAFIVGGMFGAALVLGGAAYLLQRGLAKVLAVAIRRPSPLAASLVGLVGLGLFAFDTAVVIFVVRWLYRTL